MRKLLLTILCSISLLPGMAGTLLSDEAYISLLSCSPGNDLYAHYGHTAIRVFDPEKHIDLVFNYGLFSFNDSHFYLHFIQGQTWYELGVESMREFMYEYILEHRPVSEQVLNLTPDQRESYFRALLKNSEPQNRKYLYNFVFDNCATRPIVLLEQVLGDTIISPYSGHDGMTYRRTLQYYNRRGSWADFGINLIFGRRSDIVMHGRDCIFLPEPLMRYLEHATYADGRPVVCQQQCIPFDVRPVPWYATWYFGLTILALVLIGLNIYDRRRGKRSRWADMVLYIGYAAILILVVFLTFFSIHPLVGFSWYLLIIPAIHLCTRLIYILR